MTGDPSYHVWARLDYRPAVRALYPLELLVHLPVGSRVLDVGCGRGYVSIDLATRGMRVTGIDINSAALTKARQNVPAALQKQVDFMQADFLDVDVGSFDAVLGIRFLTCLPDAGDRERAMTRFRQAVVPGGLCYIEDFLLFPQSAMYAARYAQGVALGWPYGNFTVRDRNDDLLFVAHHHSDEELERIIERFEVIARREFRSLSMNGNDVRMFEFIGRSHQPFP